MYGPYVWRRAVIILYRQIIMDDDFSKGLHYNFVQYCRYGDPADILYPFFQSLFIGAFGHDHSCNIHVLFIPSAPPWSGSTNTSEIYGGRKATNGF